MSIFHLPDKRVMTYRLSFTTGTLLVLALFAAGVAIANAQTTTTATTSTTTSSENVTPPSETATTTSVIPTTVAPARTLTPSEQQRVINLAANISNQLDALHTRLTNIAGRLEQRLTLLEATGVDTTSARLALTSAQTSLRVTTDVLSTIDQDVVAMATAPNPATVWRPLRRVYSLAYEELQIAQTALQTAIEEARTVSNY